MLAPEIPAAAPATDAATEAKAEVDFDKLVADVVNNPERVLSNDLTPEQLLELYHRIKPYAGIGGPPEKPDHKRVIAASFTNLRESYIRRTTMTSLVGFLFQIFHEWAVPAPQRTWVPAVETKNDTTTAPFAADKIVDRLETALGVAKEAQAAAQAAEAARLSALEADAVGTDPATSEANRATAAELAARAAGLLYATTHVLHRLGGDASSRLHATAIAGMQFPAVREIIARAPLPPPPGQVVVPPDVAKEIIGGFLRNWLVFDPSVHVRSGHDAAAVAAAVAQLRVGDRDVAVDTKDPERLTVEALSAPAPVPVDPEEKAALDAIMASKPRRDAAIALLRDPDLVDAALDAFNAGDAFRGYLMPLKTVKPEHANAIEIITATPASRAAIETLLSDDDFVEPALFAVQRAEAFRQYLLPIAANDPARDAATHVPPQDTFHRWEYYAAVNYESLRTIAEALYPERPDLDWALGVWAMFEGKDAEVDAAFEKHCQRYQDECVSTIRAVGFGGWTLLGDFKENRKKIQFLNSHTEVLKRIFDRHTEDQKMGAELMRKRVYTEKAKNIAEEGPDAPGLTKYKREIASKGQDLGSKGVEKVITPEQMKRLEKARGSVKAAQELELLDQHEETIKRLTELQKLRPLATDEQDELKRATDDLPRVREMLAVPDNAIQIDVFSSNPRTGEFSKSHIYTESEAPSHIAKARAEHAAAAGPAAHPAALATGLPAYAPYAAEHILQENQPRTDADRHADALRAAP